MSFERIGGEFYDLVKLVDPTPGSTNPIGNASNPFRSIAYYWNPNTLSYEVGTTGGTGVGAEVKVTNTVAISAPGTLPVSLATMPTAGGKTITYVPVAQGAAGTLLLAAAVASNKHKLVSCVLTMSADGTLKFIDDAGDVSGAMDIAAKGGFVLAASLLPYLQTSAVNKALSLVTTGGAARGVVALLTEP